MGPRLNQIHAQEHLADLHRGANRRNLAELADLRLRERAALQATDDAKILDAVREWGIVDARHIHARLGAGAGGPPKAAISRRLKELVAEGVLRNEGTRLRTRYSVAPV